MEYSFQCGMRVRHVMKKTVVTSSTTTTSSGRKRSLVEMEPRGEPFPRHDVKLVPREEYSTMSSESFSYKSINNNYDSVYERSVTTKTIEGSENRRFIEHFTKSFGHGDEQPIVVVMKNRTQIDALEWMEKRKSSATECREISNLDFFLKYPNDYSTKKKETEDKANESKILPDDAKRDKQVIPILPDEEDDEDDEDDEEESEEEYDEFEEEIVVVNIRNKPSWRKGLEIPKPQPEKVGIPIEDLLEIPTLQAKQESAPDELLIDEKVESVERLPVVFAELPDFGILNNP